MRPRPFSRSPKAETPKSESGLKVESRIGRPHFAPKGAATATSERRILGSRASDFLWLSEFGLRLSGLTLTLAALAASGLFLFSGCGKSGAGGPPPEVAMEVVIEKAVAEPVEDVLTAVGSVEANERVELKPKTAGLIEAIHFVEGQRVKQGQKLFELDARKEAASLAQAEAEEKLAQANVTRSKTLVGTKAISQQEFDQLESQLAVKAATRRLEQERLAERTIVASFDGELGPRVVSPGQYVNVGTLLGTLVDDSQVKIRVRVPERQMALVRAGQEGRLRVAAYPERVFTARIDLINPEVDETTRTVEVRLLAPNPEAILKPGMFARVELLAGTRPQAVVIPESALLASLDQFSVYVVENGAAKLKPIKLGVRMPGKIEVREGLSAGQPVVVSGTQKLVDGMKVVAAPTASKPVNGKKP